MTELEKSAIQTQLTDFEPTEPAELPGIPVITPRLKSEVVVAPAALSDEVAFRKWPYQLYEDGIHLLGGLHRTSLTVQRLAWAITHYQPDVVAVEASPKAVSQRHPEANGVGDLTESEVELAAHATTHLNWLSITGIDSDSNLQSRELGPTDREIFTEWGLLGEDDELDLDLYRSLSLTQLRDWRTETKRREPELYRDVLSQRDDAMAGHLHALRESSQFKSIVAVVGLQHLTGILDRLRDPDRIPKEDKELPPVREYQIH